MALTDKDVIDAVKDAFNTIDKRYDAALAACTTKAERDDLRGAWAAADTAYWAAIKKAFQGNDAFLQTLVSDVNATTVKLKAALQSLVNITQVIKLATEVAKTALAITKLALPLPV